MRPMNTPQIFSCGHSHKPASLANAALAQPYPTKPVKVIVPLDLPARRSTWVARLVGQHMAAALGQPMIIEDRPGAGATIGAKAVAAGGRRRLHAFCTTAANSRDCARRLQEPDLRSDQGFRPDRRPPATSPFVVVLTPTLPIHTVAELVAYAKANPGKLNWGYGLGTSPHLIGEMFKHITQTDIAAIPYRGGAQAVTDILAGQIHMNIGTTADDRCRWCAPAKLRAIAVIGEGRYPDLPEVPTMAESGVPLSLTFWTGIPGAGRRPPPTWSASSTAP